MEEMKLNWSFNEFIPTEIVFGVGRVSEIGQLAQRFGSKALLVTGPNQGARAQLYEKVIESLQKAGIQAVHFDGVIPNPTTDSITKGADMARAFGAQMVIGVGGGSAMDSAKAIAVESTHDGTAWDHLFYKDPPTDKTLPVITIGTTAGTGSQTTSVAVLTNSERKDKSAISNRNVFPRIAIVDPELTVSMPKHITAHTGFDAFCHNFEALLSVRSTPMVEALSLDAIRRVVKFLPRAIENGHDMEARIQMAWVDTLGGISNACAGTTLPHGLGMQIGGHCPHITHGQALAVVYPEFTRYTRPAAVDKFAAVARVMQQDCAILDDEAASLRCCELIDRFMKRIDMWIGFEDLGVTEEQAHEIAACGQVLGDYKRNPRVATLEEMDEMLMRSMHRERA